MTAFRVGIGYDSHRFAPGETVILAGVKIPAPFSLTGHSDADAVAHAIIDALLGAAALGDIGEMFPDSDPANRGRNSIEMLRGAVAGLKEAGWKPANVDVTVVCERPNIAKHGDAMCASLAAALGVELTAVSVKGKTNERMGWIGREEGLAVIAVATIARV